MGLHRFFSSFSRASAGVCILFNNNFQFEIIRQFSDQEGRYIIIDMKIDKILTLVNIYAPNNDNPTFFQNLLDRILSFECEEVIMGGDFNLVMDVQKNKKGGNATTHRNSLKEVQNIASSLDLIDVRRTLNPDGKRFTWRRTKPEVHCRLDYFMISSRFVQIQIFYRVIRPIIPSLQSTLLVIVTPEARASGNSIHLFCWTGSILS